LEESGLQNSVDVAVDVVWCGTMSGRKQVGGWRYGENGRWWGVNRGSWLEDDPRWL